MRWNTPLSQELQSESFESVNFIEKNWLLAEERRRRKRKKAPQNFACQTFNEGNRSKWSNASSMLHFQHAMINSPIVNISSINSKWKTKEIIVASNIFRTYLSPRLCAESADAKDCQLTQPAKNRKHRNFNVAQRFQLEWAGHLKHLNSWKRTCKLSHYHGTSKKNKLIIFVKTLLPYSFISTNISELGVCRWSSTWFLYYHGFFLPKFPKILFWYDSITIFLKEPQIYLEIISFPKKSLRNRANDFS